MNTPKRTPVSPLARRLRVAQKKSSKEKMTRIKQLEYQLVKKEKEMQLQRTEFDRQLAAKDAANQDLRQSNQKLESELQNRILSYSNLLDMYMDKELQLKQSQKKHENLREIHSRLYKKRLASIDFAVSHDKHQNSENFGEEPKNKRH